MNTIEALGVAVGAVGVVAYGATRVLGQWLSPELRARRSGLSPELQARRLRAKLAITAAPLAVGLALALVPGAVAGLAGLLAEEPLGPLGWGARALLGLSAGTMATQIHRFVRARLARASPGTLPIHTEEQEAEAEAEADAPVPPHRGQVGQ